MPGECTIYARALRTLSKYEVQQVLRYHALSEKVLSVFEREAIDGEKLHCANELEDFMEIGVIRLMSRYLVSLVAEMRRSGVPTKWVSSSGDRENNGAVEEELCSTTLHSSRALDNLFGDSIFPAKETINSSDVRTLISLSVCEVLKVLRFHVLSEMVLSVFANEAISGNKLQYANDMEDFREIGISRLTAKLLMSLVEEMRRSGVPAEWLRTSVYGEAVDTNGQSFAACALETKCEAVSTTASSEPPASHWACVYDNFWKARYLKNAAAESWLEQQAAGGNDAAKAYLMVYLSECDESTDRDLHMLGELQREALPRWLQSTDATEQMHAEFIMGYCFYWGLGYTIDDAQAMTWWRKSADRGHAEAQYWMGDLLSFSNSVPRDACQAISWCRKAAEQGHLRAQYELGVCYRDGRGVTRDHDRAIAWFRISAAKGYSLAISMLTTMKVSLE